MKAPQKQLVVSEHASAFAFNTLYTKMKKYVYPKAYCISVLNKTDTEIYKQWGANAIYIPHLVTYKAEQKNSLNTKIALNVGRLTKDKQQELLLDMWAKIKDKKGWILWIVGDGEEHDQLERKMAELQMQDSVRLLPATQSIEDIYKKASFFVFSSKSEGFGMVLLEAMSFGIPCISFDCPSGPRDIVENNRNGFLIENNNVEEYVLKLKQITSMSVENLMILGNAAFETVHEWDNASILELWDRIFK